MKIAFFDTHSFEKEYFLKANKNFNHEITFLNFKLNIETAPLVKDYDCVCSFINDKICKETVEALSYQGVKLIALRSAGFNHVDLDTCKKKGIQVVRVPEYSPYAIAEHAVGLLLTLNRKIHKAYNRVREANFSLHGLVGFDLYQKTVGVIGTGKIGTVFCDIMLGFGCKVVAYDKTPNQKLIDKGVKYLKLDELYKKSDIISLHVPLTQETRYMIDEKAFEMMKEQVVIINTSRGALVNTRSLIHNLKNKKIGSAGLDVYEEEEKFFFSDHSEEVLEDDELARLLTFPNVIVTSHQAFLTKEALENISKTTLTSIYDFENQKPLEHQVQS